jgi:two-component system, chemotaxis family, response regulator Rcp1
MPSSSCILLVEDDPNDALLILRALGDEYTQNFHAVEDGVEALEFLCQQGTFIDAPRPDLILLDLKLPKKDGRQVLSEIRADATLKSVRVIIVTSLDMEEENFRQYAGFADGYIRKSTDLEQFTKGIQRIVTAWLTIPGQPPQDPKGPPKPASDLHIDKGDGAG